MSVGIGSWREKVSGKGIGLGKLLIRDIMRGRQVYEIGMGEIRQYTVLYA